MKIQSVTPTDAASDPKHPDHDRWVKEQTLKMEVEHAQRVGKTLRDAETENAYWLERSDAKAREPQRQVTQPTPRKPREQRLAERGVTVSAPSIKQIKPSPCGRCGTCRNCMRERRVLLIMQKRKESPFFARLAEPMLRVALHLGQYSMMRKRDYERAVTAICEAACDASIPSLGEWK